MQIDAIYEDGRLVFTQPLQFARRRFPVRVEVPDHLLPTTPATDTEAEGPAPASDAGAAWLRRLATLRDEAIAAEAGAAHALPPAQEAARPER
jgi:hypothetical protein